MYKPVALPQKPPRGTGLNIALLIDFGKRNLASVLFFLIEPIYRLITGFN
jgi:hypothetical protein